MRKAWAAVIAAAALAGCGGGHGATEPTVTTPLEVAPSTTATTTSHATTSQASGAPTTGGAEFPAPVRQALAALAGRTGVPLAGPTRLGDTMTPSAFTSTTPVDGRPAWSVQVSQCDPPLPLDDPQITASPCSAEVANVALFGAIGEPSPAAAVAALPTIVSTDGTTPVRACPAGSPTTTVDRVAVARCGDTASFAEGDWTIVYSLDEGRTLAAQVTPLLTVLDKVLLPPHPGLMGVLEGGDGEHATAAWAVGATVFTDFDEHEAPGAADLASSTRSYG